MGTPVQPFFSQFEYIVPSADIHMYIRPILSAPETPSSRHPSAALRLSLFLVDSLAHAYRSFYLDNPTGGFVVAWPSFLFL